MSTSGDLFSPFETGLSFLACHGRGCLTASGSTRFAHEAWFGTNGRCVVEFYVDG